MFRYRLAPDARFPDQYNDVFQASKHILTAEVLGRYHIDPNRVAVSGDSAGANLATAVVQQVRQIPTNSFSILRKRNPQLCYFILVLIQFCNASYVIRLIY